MKIIDTQVHLWAQSQLEQTSTSDGAASIGPGHRSNPLCAVEMLSIMDRTGVHHVVIVPPSIVGDDNSMAIDAATHFPSRFSVMGRFDPIARDAVDRLRAWRDQPGMRGIRLTFHKPPSNEWLASDLLHPIWRTCEALQMPVMIFLPGLLHHVPQVAERHPGLPLIIDHMARNVGLRDAECFADLPQLIALARYPNVTVKASSLPYYSTEPYPFANLASYIRRTFDAFGSRRMMWGSDFTKLRCTYTECIDHFRHSLDFLSEEDKEWILAKSAAQILQIPR